MVHDDDEDGDIVGVGVIAVINLVAVVGSGCLTVSSVGGSSNSVFTK